MIDTTNVAATPVSDSTLSAEALAALSPASASAAMAPVTLQFNTSLPTDLLDALEQLPSWLITCAAADRIFDQLSASPFYHALVQRPRAELLVRMASAPAVYAEIIVRRYFRLSNRASLQEILPLSSLFCNADQFAECVAFVRADSLKDFQRFKDDVLCTLEHASAHVQGGLGVVPDAKVPAATSSLTAPSASPPTFAAPPSPRATSNSSSTYLKEFVPAMSLDSVAHAVYAANISLAAFASRVHAATVDSCGTFMARARLTLAYISYLNIVFLFEGLVHMYAFLTSLSEMGQGGLDPTKTGSLHSMRLLIRTTISLVGLVLNLLPLIAPSVAHVRRAPFFCCLPRRAKTLVSAAPYVFLEEGEGSNVRHDEPVEVEAEPTPEPGVAAVAEQADVVAPLPPKTPVRVRALHAFGFILLRARYVILVKILPQVPPIDVGAGTPRSMRSGARSIVRQTRANSDTGSAAVKDSTSSSALGAALMRFRAVTSGAARLARTVWFYSIASTRASGLIVA